jgi:hypothetical protein
MKNANAAQSWYKLALLLGAVVVTRVVVSKTPPLARGAANHLTQNGMVKGMQNLYKFPKNS